MSQLPEGNHPHKKIHLQEKPIPALSKVLPLEATVWFLEVKFLFVYLLQLISTSPVYSHL